MYSVLSSKQGASTLSTSKHGAFLVWVILMGLISFLAFFVWDQEFNFQRLKLRIAQS